MEWRYLVVFITAPKDRGWDIANYIVEQKLGACVNVVSEVSSVYWWKGNIEKDKESLLIIKTSVEKFEKLIVEVKKIHPYTVPEIIAMPIVGGNEDYLKWIDDSLGQ
ncbi:divalent-cation tolerance protein CutA [Thermocrinis jamiesonii]|jgi:Uncharacterized protein involved in tolerance to divalent cations|uniref:divalent-cation tolerance protein CutA n=1 Tax=Thermocrinis jamiesonii TaxID=1302351 RepID=UPI00049763E4|nr:divalent-cation tolerance protein CutA [Thermocrinis jamiesonii]